MISFDFELLVGPSLLANGFSQYSDHLKTPIGRINFDIQMKQSKNQSKEQSLIDNIDNFR